MGTVFFWISAALAVVSALSILFVKKPTRALLALLVCMICLGVLYTLLHAYFVAIVHLIVYAGAVLVLFLFVIMLEGLGATTLPIQRRFTPLHLALTAAAGLIFSFFIVKILCSSKLPSLQNAAGTVENLGKNLFTNYLLPFELVAVLILVGIFAAVSLIKPENKKS